MNFFDYNIITYVNQASQHSWFFDNFITLLAGNRLLKGGVLVIIIWWAWFKSEKHQSYIREHIMLTLFSCVVATILSRALALILPFRLKPLEVESLNFLLPLGSPPTTLGGLSSFPSDHAVLFIALSTGLFFISKRLGAFALSFTVLIIIFPRLYLGFHYPTDIIAGAIIGMTVALLGNIFLVKSINIRSVTDWSYSRPSLFYPLFFLLTYQIADLFNSSRNMVTGEVKLIQGIIS